jgi:uncharacterized membrane protein YhdT
VKARVVAAARGAIWLAQGWRLFRASPLGWLALVFTYLMGTMLVSAFPLVGPLAVSLLVPAFSVGFMTASRAAWRHQPVDLVTLFAGFRERLPAQLVLGGVYTAGFAAAIAGSALLDGGVLLRALFSPTAAPDAAPEGDGLLAGMLASVLIYLPTMMMLWFAPVLVAWHAVAPAKALFYSLAAFWLNLRAFLVYALALALALFVIVGAVTLLAAFLAGDAPAASARSLVFPMALVVLPILFASYYASYQDVFGTAESG